MVTIPAGCSTRGSYNLFYDSIPDTKGRDLTKSYQKYASLSNASRKMLVSSTKSSFSPGIAYSFNGENPSKETGITYKTNFSNYRKNY
jgi:hypothetical protein